jgi:hypothetical protein
VARPHYDQLLVGSVEDEKVWDRLEKKVDAVIFGDVLEHTADPVRVLGLALQRVNDHGLVIVSVPNVAHLRVRLRLLLGRFDYEEWGIMDRTHLRFFTLASAAGMLRDAGLRVLHTEPVYDFPIPPGLSPLRRQAVSLRRGLRRLLAAVRPTLVARQFILVSEAPPRP